MPDEQFRKPLSEAKQKPRNFVLCVNGSDVAVMLSKKWISESQKKEAKGKTGNAGRLFTGVVGAGPDGLAFNSWTTCRMARRRTAFQPTSAQAAFAYG
jgi:hypothetical protein